MNNLSVHIKDNDIKLISSDFIINLTLEEAKDLLEKLSEAIKKPKAISEIETLFLLKRIQKSVCPSPANMGNKEELETLQSIGLVSLKFIGDPWTSMYFDEDWHWQLTEKGKKLIEENNEA